MPHSNCGNNKTKVAARIAIMLRQQFAKLTCFHFIALKYYIKMQFHLHENATLTLAYDT